MEDPVVIVLRGSWIELPAVAVPIAFLVTAAELFVESVADADRGSEFLDHVQVRRRSALGLVIIIGLRFQGRVNVVEADKHRLFFHDCLVQ